MPSRLAPGAHDAALGDVTLHYIVAGSGPVLMVCSPGWGAGSVYLQHGLASLGKQRTLVFIDTRGSGGSSRPADRLRMGHAEMADDIERLRSYLGLQSIALLGHSDSGAIAIRYAERYPEHIDQLIVVDGLAYGVSRFDAAEAADFARIGKMLESEPKYRDAARASKAFNPTTDEQMAEQMKAEMAVYFADPQRNIPAFVATLDGLHPSSWAAKAEFEADRAAAKAGAMREMEDLPLIRARTLIVVGKQDWKCPERVATDLHTDIRGSRLVVIDGSGHFPWIEQPDTFFSTVADFLARR